MSNNNDNFFDFMVFYELMFPDEPDKTIECLSCGRTIKGDEKVAWANKENKIFRCPDCDEEIAIE